MRGEREIGRGESNYGREWENVQCAVFESIGQGENKLNTLVVVYKIYTNTTNHNVFLAIVEANKFIIKDSCGRE